MGKKLGNALIIYGVLNFLVSFAFSNVALVLGAFIWMVIMIAMGNWQRSKGRAEAARDQQTALLKQIAEENQREDLRRRINDASTGWPGGN